jgi:hypothetical protein
LIFDRLRASRTERPGNKGVKMNERPVPEIAYVAMPQRNRLSEFARVYVKGSENYFAVLYPVNKYENKVFTVLITTEPDLDNDFSASVASLYFDTFQIDHSLRSIALMLPPF